MPLMVTFFNVRRGRDTIFKRSMRHFFPQTMRRYESEFGIRFVGWFNVTEGSDWNNMVILARGRARDRRWPDSDPSARGLAHRIAESVFEKKHIIFLRERMGPDLVFKP